MAATVRHGLFNAMKTLSPAEIESLLGAGPAKGHPLDILGYGFDSDGVRRFRTEQPDFLPQIVAYVQAVLARAGIFPEATNHDDPGFATFIYADGASFRISRMEEVGVTRYKRISTGPLPEAEAVLEYIRRVANPDYVRCGRPMRPSAGRGVHEILGSTPI